jgi:hypothetical protein
MTKELINRLAWRTGFSYGQIEAYIHRIYAVYGTSVSDEVLTYNILEAFAMNIDLDILGAPQPVLEDFCGAAVF